MQRMLLEAKELTRQGPNRIRARTRACEDNAPRASRPNWATSTIGSGCSFSGDDLSSIISRRTRALLTKIVLFPGAAHHSRPPLMAGRRYKRADLNE